MADAGETALMLALLRPSDLALLDIGLPDMDGLQVLAALRTDARTMSMPVVILCSWDDPELIRRGFELGEVQYLVKTEAAPARVRLRRPLDHGTRHAAARCVRGFILFT